jgi:hypothetical protein
VWWKEAATAFGDRPLQGWGAGSFPVVHLLYRRDTLPVQQPHNVPLQFLAETGVVGAVLGIGAFVLLVAGAAAVVRSRPAGSQRLMAGALLGAAVGYGAHCLYDWDWNIPALSLPAFLFLGVVAGGHRIAPRVSVVDQTASSRSAWRGWALAGVSLWLCVLALSVELPQLAADKASAALVSASSASPASVRAAQREASVATELDPLSDAGLLAQATVALHESRPALARVYLSEAVARNPSDPEAWRLLAQVEYYALRDRQGGISALQRELALDPMGPDAHVILGGQLHQAPPGSSATRFPSPAP